MSEPLTSPSASDSEPDDVTSTGPSQTRRGTRGRGRGRGRASKMAARGRPRGRTAAAASANSRSKTSTRANSTATSSSRESSLSVRRSASPELAAPSSPELAAPSDDQDQVEAGQEHDQEGRIDGADYSSVQRAKSSSLSDPSSKSPSPEPQASSVAGANPGARIDAQARLRTASISSALSALTDRRDDEDSNGDDTEDSASVIPLPSSGRRRPPPKKVYNGTSDEDEEESDFGESQASPRRGKAQSRTSGASTTGGTAPARGRGRPRGSKKSFPATNRSARTSTGTNGKVSGGTNGAVSSTGMAAGARATRATVTLPPGYIEGVKGSRWPRLHKPESATSAQSDDDEVLSDAPSISAASDDGQAKVVGVDATENPNDAASEVDTKPSVPNDAIDTDDSAPVIAPATSLATGKDEKSSMPVLTPDATPTPLPEQPVEPLETLSAENGQIKEAIVEAVVEAVKEVTANRVASPAPKASSKATPRNRKGKKGKEKAAPAQPADKEDKTDPPERSAVVKRRKLDAAALERAAARAAARSVFLAELGKEEKAILAGEHPLLKATREAIASEKARRLRNMKTTLEWKEREFARVMNASAERIWKQWADEKDAKRMSMFLDNHNSLKQLVNEEKSFPFLRDHLLLASQHGLPPTPYYRAPILESDTTFVPRNVIHAGHYLEAPPTNPALDHSAWSLAAEEVDSDLAILRECSDSCAAPSIVPAAIPPMYGYPPPYYYDNPYQAAPPMPPQQPMSAYPGHPSYYVPTPLQSQQQQQSHGDSAQHHRVSSYGGGLPPPSALTSYDSPFGGLHSRSASTHVSNPATIEPPRPNSQLPFPSGTGADHYNSLGGGGVSSAPSKSPLHALSAPSSALNSAQHQQRPIYSAQHSSNGSTGTGAAAGAVAPLTSTVLTGGMTAASRSNSSHWYNTSNAPQHSKALSSTVPSVTTTAPGLQQQQHHHHYHHHHHHSRPQQHRAPHQQTYGWGMPSPLASAPPPNPQPSGASNPPTTATANGTAPSKSVGAGVPAARPMHSFWS